MSDQLPDVAFIGGGNMGSAIIAGLARRAHPPAITVCDPATPVRELHAAAGHHVTDDAREAIDRAQIVVLAIKPQMSAAVIPPLAGSIGGRHLVVSILAGITTSWLESHLTGGCRVVRAMPNTPMAIGAGMVGICRGRHADSNDLDLAETLFASAATVLRVEEAQMDALTAVSGSGPAYVFRFAEALLAAAGDLGFDPDQARTLVAATLDGSVRYLLAQEDFPAERLRRQVTSPGGTTAAALEVFEQHRFPAIVTEALRAARDRSRELGPPA